MIGLNDGIGAAALLLQRTTGQVFSPGGWLETGLGLEHRACQEQMALAVADAFAGDEVFLAEAGTGTGKSLAYLVPGLLHAVRAERKLLVSTHTISLQEQILHKDLELCRTLFRKVPELRPVADFRAALLVGKANYLCTTRLAHALAQKKELFPTAEHDELERLARWAERSPEGLRHELTPAPLPDVWEWVNADSSTCSPRNCDPKTCPYQRARSRIAQANAVVLNHSLLFALLGAGMAPSGDARGVLMADDFLVLDEAHTVPEVATDHFGLRLSSYGLDRLLRQIFNPEKKRGFLQKHGLAADRQAVADALEASAQFFGFLRERLLDKRAVVRVREPGFAEPWLEEPLAGVAAVLARLSDRFDDGRERDEVRDLLERVNAHRSGLRDFLALGTPGHVYFMERTGKGGGIVTLRTAPIDVAPALREHLFRKNTAVVLTSATLAAGGSMDAFVARSGAGGARTLVAASPFDYERNMRVYVAEDVPQPSAAEGGRLDLGVLADYIWFCADRVPGGTLVLFTSYGDLRAVAERIGEKITASGRPLYVQGGGHGRTEMTRRFKAAANGVLLGTASFWTGVDVPGEALSQVIITRLPFEPPDHPVAEARAEWVRDSGGSPFNELTLPAALIQFRQGIGRLIRTRTDRGLITNLDSRVLTKNYGRLFLDCLPVRQFLRISRSNRDERFQPFPPTT